MITPKRLSSRQASSDLLLWEELRNIKSPVQEADSRGISTSGKNCAVGSFNISFITWRADNVREKWKKVHNSVEFCYFRWSIFTFEDQRPMSGQRELRLSELHGLVCPLIPWISNWQETGKANFYIDVHCYVFFSFASFLSWQTTYLCWKNFTPLVINTLLGGGESGKTELTISASVGLGFSQLRQKKTPKNRYSCDEYTHMM